MYLTDTVQLKAYQYGGLIFQRYIFSNSLTFVLLTRPAGRMKSSLPQARIDPPHERRGKSPNRAGTRQCLKTVPFSKRRRSPAGPAAACRSPSAGEARPGPSRRPGPGPARRSTRQPGPGAGRPPRSQRHREWRRRRCSSRPSRRRAPR